MRILVAEDEENISLLYRIALENRHHEVVSTKDGQECVDLFARNMKDGQNSGTLSKTIFDAVILDYRMPRMDGMEAAKQILKMHPKQRIIFASAYVKETLVESIKELDQVVELLQKPFEIDVLIDTVEDKTIYQQLRDLNVNIKHIKDWNPTHAQVLDLLEGLLKLRAPDFDFHKVVAAKDKTGHFAHTSQSAG
ncbi:MAG TPA: response regulator [Nitrososphaera sp.]|jgi:CheY-like chemotaxis protein